MLRSNDNLYINLDTIEMLKDSFNKEIQLFNRTKIIKNSQNLNIIKKKFYKTTFVKNPDILWLIYCFIN